MIERSPKACLGECHKEREDRGDEVDGVFWKVEGVYVLSPAGEKYKDKINRAFWTEFG